ncbi:MAG: DinB family protein, partial [Dehalococcoidia bacterium]
MRTVPSEHREAFARYIAAPSDLRQALAGSDRTRLGQPGPDGWSVRGLMLHLADSEVVAGHALRSILGGDEEIPETDIDGWDRRLGYMWRDAEAALALFRILRFSNAELLQHADNPAWKRRSRRGSALLGPADILNESVAHC